MTSFYLPDKKNLQGKMDDRSGCCSSGIGAIIFCMAIFLSVVMALKAKNLTNEFRLCQMCVHISSIVGSFILSGNR